MRIAYIYDRPGWALHNLGLLLQERLAASGVQVECLSNEEWHGAPRAVDRLYLSYSGLMQDHFDYRRWAGSVLTTVHDPCEVSFFEDRSDWARFPMYSVPFDRFDRVSVISAELHELIPRVYGVPVFRTPTWPTTSVAESAGDAPAGAGCVAMSSTILPEYFSVRQMLRRIRQLHHYSTDARGHRSLMQLRGLAVRRRRKNIGWLRAIEGTFADRPGMQTVFRYGAAGPLPREAYVEQLRRANVYVCTSTMEGGPLPVMEAVQAGLAVVSTPVGQVEEWVTDGVNGRICRSLQECIDALETYRRDPAMLAAHQLASRTLAARRVFPVDEWVRFLRAD